MWKHEYAGVSSVMCDSDTIPCGGEDADPIYTQPIRMDNSDAFAIYYKGTTGIKVKISYEISGVVLPQLDSDYAPGEEIEDSFEETTWVASPIIPVLCLWARLKIERLAGNDANAELDVAALKREVRSWEVI